MSLNRISAAEAASLIKHGYNIGLSGFTPAGTAKAVTAELAKIAEAEHAKKPVSSRNFPGVHRQESPATAYCHVPKPSATAPLILPTLISAKL